MSECPNLKTCAFVTYFEKTKGSSLALNGFINSYCKGSRQDECKRRKVSKALGGPVFVPANMMPNGLPLTGTNGNDWPKQVKDNI